MSIAHAARYPARAPRRAPTGPQEINRNHWLAGQCRGLWLPGRGMPQNLASGEVSVTTAPLEQVGPGGPSMRQDGTQGIGWRVRDGAILAGLDQWTILAVANCTSASGNGGPIYSERLSGNSIVKLEFNGSAQLMMTYRNSAGNLIQPTGTTVVGAAPRVLGASLSPATATVRVYVDGVREASTAWANSNAASAVQTTLGYDASFSGTWWIGNLYMAAAFARGLTDEEHAAFAADPYGLLIPAG